MGIKFKKTQLTFAETLRIVTDAVDACFVTDENGKDVDYMPECKDVSLQCAFYENYADGTLSDNFEEAFNTYMSVDIDELHINGHSFNYGQWVSICKSVNEKIEYRKQRLLDSKSAQSEMYTALNTLLSTLNSKAKELDVKKLEKVINKLNPKAVMKAYQDSNIGDGLRDKTIQEQSKIINDLKNQISSRNVKA